MSYTKPKRSMPRVKLLDSARPSIVIMQDEVGPEHVKYAHVLVLSLAQAAKFIERMHDVMAKVQRGADQARPRRAKRK